MARSWLGRGSGSLVAEKKGDLISNSECVLILKKGVAALLGLR